MGFIELKEEGWIGGLRKLDVNDLYFAVNTLGDVVFETDKNSILKYHLETTES